jgi:hypothetical protein
MGNLVVLFIHLIATMARLLGPGGVRSVVAESLLIKHQLLIVNRSRHRYTMDKWIYPRLGSLLLADVNNRAMRELVEKMATALSAPVSATTRTS